MAALKKKTVRLEVEQFDEDWHSPDFEDRDFHVDENMKKGAWVCRHGLKELWELPKGVETCWITASNKRLTCDSVLLEYRKVKNEWGGWDFRYRFDGKEKDGLQPSRSGRKALIASKIPVKGEDGWYGVWLTLHYEEPPKKSRSRKKAAGTMLSRSSGSR